MTIRETAETEGEPWEKEVVAKHRWRRWGGSEDEAEDELARLRKLREAAGQLDDDCRKLTDQIISLEICNWRMEDSMLALCEAIGKKRPAQCGIGHMNSMTGERWKRIWAYDLSLRHWGSSKQHRNGYATLLAFCDPEGEIRDHVAGMLGEPSDLKALCGERLCLVIEFMLGSHLTSDLPAAISHRAAVAAIDAEIRKLDPGGGILEGIRFSEHHHTYAGMELCHHKIFRRLDIAISSIGAGKWRGTMPQCATSASDRVTELDQYLAPLAAWIDGRDEATEDEDKRIFRDIRSSLGKPDATKIFLASLLCSLMRSQQASARRLAEQRAEQAKH